MVTHSILIALLAAAPAASPIDSSADGEASSAATAVTESRTAQQLRDAVHAAMRRQATARGDEQQAAVRELAAVYREVIASTSLPPREQRELRALLRSRLARTSKALERQLARTSVDAKQRPARQAAPRAKGQPPEKRAILAQAQGNLPGQPAAGRQPGGAAANFGPGAQVAGAAQSWNAQTNRNAQDLIELIERTIAPASWDTNGGLGTMMYFAPAQVLVIRQTGGIHGQVGQAIQGLRGN